jgi:sphingomyelin phosphodiesterase
LATGPPLPPGSVLPASNLSQAAVYWGNYKCDSPWPLAISAMQSVTKLNGDQPVDMSIYTGDMVTHDSNWHISNDLVRYTQQAIFDSMKKFLGSGPVFSAIGNHDTAPSDFASPRSLPSKTL